MLLFKWWASRSLTDLPVNEFLEAKQLNEAAQMVLWLLLRLQAIGRKNVITSVRQQASGPPQKAV